MAFYIGSAIDARTRQALAKMPPTPRSVVIVASPSRAASFMTQFGECFAPSGRTNVLPLFGHKGPCIQLAQQGSLALHAGDESRQVFIEDLATRPADVLKTVAIAAALGRLVVQKGVAISAGIYAGSDGESLTFERSLADLNVPSKLIVAGWLNGIGNNPIRYVRVPAQAIARLYHTAPLTDSQGTSRVVGFSRQTFNRGHQL